MPIYDEPPAPQVDVRVSPSAALELFWITFRCCERARNNPIFSAGDRRSAELAQRTQEFWGPSDEGFAEFLVIAQRRGLLLGESPDELLGSLPVAALRTDDLTLASETPETRALIIERMDRLRGDAGLRRRYLALLRDLWRAVRSEWMTLGRAAVQSACEVAERRLASGEEAADLAPRLSAPSLVLLRRASGAEIAVCPGYFSGRCLWELPGTLLVGIPAEGASQVAADRARAEAMAPKLKALSDPTRLAMLLRLGRGPASITDVTREFGISQPAVSVHFRVLRDAELVTGAREGNRTMYSVDSRHAADLVHELSESLTVE
ncbi:MAG: ArsR/SmtB family transcription factor [Candidatus Dormibacteria bacterium]